MRRWAAGLVAVLACGGSVSSSSPPGRTPQTRQTAAAHGVSARLTLDGTPGSGTAPDLEGFDASGSHSLDPNASIASYVWDFGDGTQGSGAKTSHTFALPGTYSVQVHVTDTLGESADADLTVVVSAPSTSDARAYVWTRSFSDLPSLVATPDGSVFADIPQPVTNASWEARTYALGQDGADHGSFVLRTVDSVPRDLPQLIAASADQLYGVSAISTPGGPLPRIDRWTLSGDLQTSVFSGSDVSHFLPFTVSPSDDWAMEGGEFSSVHLDEHRDGSDSRTQLPLNFRLSKLAFDPGGNLIIAGISTVSTAWGHSFEGGPFLAKLAPSGALLWALELTGASGDFSGLATSSAGTVVAAVQFSGQYAFGDSTGPTGDVLLTIDSDGQPRWTRSLPSANTPWKLAVDSGGLAALYSVQDGTDCGAHGTVLRFNLAGDALATTVITPADCTGGMAASAIVFSNHHVVVAGYSSGGTNVSGPGGFVTELAP